MRGEGTVGCGTPFPRIARRAPHLCRTSSRIAVLGSRAAIASTAVSSGPLRNMNLAGDKQGARRGQGSEIVGELCAITVCHS